MCARGGLRAVGGGDVFVRAGGGGGGEGCVLGLCADIKPIKVIRNVFFHSAPS